MTDRIEPLQLMTNRSVLGVELGGSLQAIDRPRVVFVNHSSNTLLDQLSNTLRWPVRCELQRVAQSRHLDRWHCCGSR